MIMNEVYHAQIAIHVQNPRLNVEAVNSRNEQHCVHLYRFQVQIILQIVILLVLCIELIIIPHSIV